MLLLFLTSILLAAQPTRRAKDFDRGGNLYQQNCWMCHGKLGEGNGPAATALQVDSPALAKRIDSSEEHAMVSVILDGRGDMPSFSQTFSREDALRILTWLENPKPVRKSKAKDKNAKKKKKPKSRKPKKSD